MYGIYVRMLDVSVLCVCSLISSCTQLLVQDTENAWTVALLAMVKVRYTQHTHAHTRAHTRTHPDALADTGGSGRPECLCLNNSSSRAQHYTAHTRQPHSGSEVLRKLLPQTGQVRVYVHVYHMTQSYHMIHKYFRNFLTLQRVCKVCRYRPYLECEFVNCLLFVSSVVIPLFITHLYKCKPISTIAAEQVRVKNPLQ